MGTEHSGSLFHLDIRWLMRKGAGGSGPRNDTGALLKEQNHNFAKRFNVSKLIVSQPFLDFFILLKLLNISMQRKGKIFFDVSKPSPRLKAKWIH